jgi:endonuclease/exonuclease/phosphatase family metal-dependent hydrolase
MRPAPRHQGPGIPARQSLESALWPSGPCPEPASRRPEYRAETPSDEFFLRISCSVKLRMPIASRSRLSPARRLRPKWRRARARPHPVESRLVAKRDPHLRLLTLNVAHGWKNHPRHSLLRRQPVRRHIHELAESLQRLGPDVIALQEADGPSMWSGNFDHVSVLARLTDLEEYYRGEHNSFGFGRFNLESGTALLATRPLRDPSSHRFASNWRDTKGFVVATVAVPEWGAAASIDLVSVHLDFLAPMVRRRQMKRLVETLTARRRPLVVLGDLNCCWHREPKSMKLLAGTLGLRAFQPDQRAPTYPAARPRRRFDWILVSRELDFAGYSTVRVPHSDHLVVAADLRPTKQAWAGLAIEGPRKAADAGG